MKNSLKSISRGIICLFISLLILFKVSSGNVYGQGGGIIMGKLADSKTGQPIPYATISLLRLSDSVAIDGAMSDDDGRFNFKHGFQGRYILSVSNIGYKQATKYIEVTGKEVTDAGTIILQETSIMLNELVVTGEKVKAKAEADRTSYNITEKMMLASANGTDVLKLVPGIQVDMMQNISLEGSSLIMIYVDGRERDKDYVSQLNPVDIDKIEIISIPTSEYDGNITGAINIILKKNRNSGIKGQFLVELPTSRSVVYIFPNYSLSYSYKCLNFYTSYNGEAIYFNQLENFSREFRDGFDTSHIEINQNVIQKNWSNRFHYGIDFIPDDRNQFNFYAYINPYSQELDGEAKFKVSGLENNLWLSRKDDIDKNRGSFYSLYYKHAFNKKGNNISTDISWYTLKAENITLYYNEGDEILLKNTVKPGQEMLSMKVDYSDLFFNKLSFSSGIKGKFQTSTDKMNAFEYHENILAFYLNCKYNLSKLDLIAGLRVEKFFVNQKYSFSKSDLAFFPYTSIRYRLNGSQSLQLTFNRSIKRPNLFQLNPYTISNDPWSTTTGNPLLRPEYLASINLQHSIQFRGNYLASQVFFNRADNVINNLTHVSGAGKFNSKFHNLGFMSQYGVQVSGSLKVGFLTLNPLIRIYSFHTSGNDLAKRYNIEPRNRPGLESGLSAILSFKHDVAFSGTFQYNTSKYDIQSRYFSDMTYFLSLEKTFKKNFKAGIAGAIPFTKTFTYNGSEINSMDFHSLYEGQVLMASLPVWFRVGYTFSSGKNKEKINREKEEVENLRKKGF